MDNATHKDLKFYFCTLIGAALMFTALWVPPVGVLDLSILYGSASFLILAGVIEGADIKGIIHEIRLLKEEIDSQKMNNTKDA